MKRWFAILLSFVITLCVPFEVKAADLNFTHPTYSINFTGINTTVTIPWNATYTLEFAGQAGNTYGSTADCAPINTVDIWLNKGDVLTFQCEANNTVNQEGDVLYVHGGNNTKVFLNNVKIYETLGGKGTVSSTVSSSINRVVLFNANDDNSTSYGVHYHTGTPGVNGGCYSVTYCGGSITNDCFDPLPGGGYEETDNHVYCMKCHKGYGTYDHDYRYPQSTCNAVTGSYINCGHAQGEVLGYSPSINNTGNRSKGYVKISIKPCNAYFNNKAVSYLNFKSYNYNIVVLDDTVVYCRHGTLN